MTELYIDCYPKAIGKFAILLGKFAELIRKFTHRKDIITVYRDRLDEIRREKGISNKRWSEESGVSIDTISRIVHPENPEKDSPRVNTLEDLCKALGVELWEIFYMGDRSFVSLQARIAALEAERDALIAENGALKNTVATLHGTVNDLKNEIIYAQHYYITHETDK